jgi:hypothetical protein
MGTGVGEAMLLGAAMGGGSAAMTGGDPLKGALLGGLTGGVGSGIGGALGGAGAAGTEAALGAAGTELATNAAMANALPVSSMAANPVATAGLTPISAGQSFAQASQLANTTSGVNAAMNQALPLTGNLSSAGISGLPAASTSPFIPTPPAVAPPVVAPPTFGEGMAKFASDPMASLKANPFTAAASGMAGAIGAKPDPYMPEEYDGPLKRFRLSQDFRAPVPYAGGGIADLGAGGYDRMVGEQPMYPSNMAAGGISNLGSYSDYARGGRMLKGPGDGMSDSIPASIGGKRPARLATEEFVVPADVVSHLGNGSSDAGAKQLYAMMDKVRTARTGRKSQSKEINPRKYMPTYA